MAYFNQARNDNTLRKSFMDWLWQSKRKARQIDLPLLVLLGGCDYVAQHSGTSSFLRRVPAKEQRIVTFPQAYHCLLHDSDTPTVIRVMTLWLTAYSGHNSAL